MTQLIDAEWDLLVDAIRQEKCIIFLGPGATVNYGQSDRLDKFLGDTLKASLPPAFQKSVVAYNPLDRFFVLDKPASRNKLYRPLKEFYAVERPNALLDKLAEIPFHLAMTVTPDLSLNQAFERNGIAFSHQYFDKAVCRELPEPPTKAKPLIYNLFGCILADETLITTHLDLFETLKSLFAGGRLPNDLVQRMGSNQLWQIVFLGFEFEKWYYQLILYLLNLNNDVAERIAADQDAGMNQPVKAFFETDFRINFISDGLLDFVQELHGRLKPGELRKGGQGMAVSKKYSLLNIYNLLENAFSAVDYESFCLIHFPEVHKEFTPGMTQSLRINLLMDYCGRMGKYDFLLQACEQANPFQFNQCGPYYHES